MAEVRGYPRPQLRRSKWINLNGEWQFAFDRDAIWEHPAEVVFDRKIRVPFSPEAPLSGIADTGFYKSCWYRRTFERPEMKPGEGLALHFGAVDYSATVWVNGKLAVHHDGGYTPFWAEITDLLSPQGEQEIVVRAEDDLLKVLMKLPLEFQPGEKWNYSNSGYMLLGFVIHKASGKFYGDVLEERVFGPLGMTTAQVISESDIVPNRAAGYELKDGKIKNQDWVSPTLNTTADGALYLTAIDMSHWAEGLNGNRLLKTESFKQMWTPVKLNNGTSYPYGFGWRLGYQRGHRVIEHSGHWQGFSTAICRYPDFGLTVIALANLSDLSSLTIAEDIAGIHETQLQTPRSIKSPTSPGDPQLTEELKQMLTDVGQKKNSKSLMPAFQSTVDKDTREAVAKMMKEMKSFDSLGCDQVKEPMELFGGQPTQYCYYRLISDKESRTLVAGITADKKVTEFSLGE